MLVQDPKARKKEEDKIPGQYYKYAHGPQVYRNPKVGVLQWHKQTLKKKHHKKCQQHI